MHGSQTRGMKIKRNVNSTNVTKEFIVCFILLIFLCTFHLYVYKCILHWRECPSSVGKEMLSFLNHFLSFTCHSFAFLVALLIKNNIKKTKWIFRSSPFVTVSHRFNHYNVCETDANAVNSLRNCILFHSLQSEHISYILTVGISTSLLFTNFQTKRILLRFIQATIQFLLFNNQPKITGTGNCHTK